MSQEGVFESEPATILEDYNRFDVTVTLEQDSQFLLFFDLPNTTQRNEFLLEVFKQLTDEELDQLVKISCYQSGNKPISSIGQFYFDSNNDDLKFKNLFKLKRIQNLSQEIDI